MELTVSFGTAIINVVMGLFAYFKNPRSASNRLLLMLTIEVAGWAIFNYFSLHSPSATETLFWIRMVMVITSPIGPTIFLLAHTFPRPQVSISKSVRLMLLLLSSVSAILAASPYMFTDVVITADNIAPTPGPGIIVFAISFVGFIAAGLITIIIKFFKTRGKERVQVKYLLFGLVTTFTLMIITNFLMVVLLRLSLFVVFGPLFSLFLVISLTYAIVKHRFLDIRLVVARTVSYFLLVITLAVLYAVSFFVIGFLLFNFEKSLLNLALSTFLCLIIAITFQPLNRFLQKTTDRFLFKDKYEPATLLYKIATTLAATQTLSDLSYQFIEILTQRMKINGAAIILKEEKKFKIIKSVNILANSNLNEVADLLHCHQLSFFDEMAESKLKEFCRQNEIMVISPLKASSELIGYLALGHKLSGDVYTTDDESIFKIAAPQLAISLQNAQHFDQIQQFNITLKEEVQKATTKLRAANSQLKELDKLKDEFISVASHELRTPLTALRGYLWMAVKTKNVSEQIKKYLARAFSSSEQVISLTNDILDVSKIEGNKFELIPSSFDLVKLIDEVKEELMNKAQDKKQTIEFTSPQVHWVTADQPKIRRVLVNLIGNAIKFTPEKGKISITIIEDKNNIEVDITDTGIGISKNNMNKIFKKFGQINRTLATANREPGTGLGLYICKNIIELSKGKIWVTSQVDKGSTFSFTLPKGI